MTFEKPKTIHVVFHMRKFKLKYKIGGWVICVITLKTIIDGRFKVSVFITSSLRTVLSNTECKSISRSCTVSSAKMFLFQLFIWFALFNDSPQESSRTLYIV